MTKPMKLAHIKTPNLFIKYVCQCMANKDHMSIRGLRFFVEDKLPKKQDNKGIYSNPSPPPQHRDAHHFLINEAAALIQAADPDAPAGFKSFVPVFLADIGFLDVQDDIAIIRYVAQAIRDRSISTLMVLREQVGKIKILPKELEIILLFIDQTESLIKTTNKEATNVNTQ